jgi:hypothetical protein
METKRIGLSLGADICWPACVEELLERWDPVFEIDGRSVRFEVERVTVEPFDLRYTPNYDVVLDRLTHWYPVSREWIKKITLMDGVYVLNNPWAIQSMEKHTTYCAMMRLGLPIPTTWMIPAKEYDPEEQDLQTTIKRYNKLFDLDQVGDQVGYPAFLKPYDGGGWVGVRRATDHASLRAAYDDSGRRVHHLQEAVPDWDVFVRAVGVGPQINVIRYDPDKPLHGRYVVDFNYLTGPEWQTASKITRVINAFFGWDFNSCEMLRSAGTLHPIDYANACPDSQVTSLHYHFPWLVLSLMKWSMFCAATNRPMKLNLDWAPYLAIADTPGLSFEEKLDRYDALARAHFSSDEFAAFSAQHFGELDAIALEFFGSERFREIVREKVAALYPAHEIETFTEHFFGLVQFWRKTHSDVVEARDA